MCISIAIDSNKYDSKDVKLYTEVYERLFDIAEGSDQLNYFYIDGLKKVIESYTDQEYIVIEHYFGLNGHNSKDIGSIAIIMHSFISYTLGIYNKILQELKQQKYLFDPILLVNYYNEEIKKYKRELSAIRKKSSKYKDYEKIENLIELISQYNEKRDKVLNELKMAKRAYKKYA